MPGVTAGYSIFINVLIGSHTRAKYYNPRMPLSYRTGLLPLDIRLRWEYTTTCTASPKKKKKWEKWCIFANFKDNEERLNAVRIEVSWVSHKIEDWCHCHNAELHITHWHAMLNDGLKVPIVPVLHLRSSVLVLLAPALEYLRRQLDSLEHHGNGKLRIEADQCTLGIVATISWI